MKVGSRLYTVVDTLVVILCLPFYAVLFPCVAVYQFAAVKRRLIHVGTTATHLSGLEIKKELRVVDVSRLSQGVVGYQKRDVFLRDREIVRPFSDEIEYCTRGEFWFGDGYLLGSRKR